MRHWLAGSLLSASLLATSAAAAQQPAQPSDGQEIVVTGTRDLDKQLSDFVGALATAPPRGQLSRFESAVCPTVVGVSPEHRDKVIARMRRVAQGSGIEVGAAGCVPNVLLVVTGDKRAFLEALARRHAYYFGNMSGAEIRRIIREPGPAAAWQVAGDLRNADGRVIGTESEILVNRTGRSGSRISAGARPQFAAAAVVVDAKALDGLSTTQLADYAAMRAFTRTDPTKLAGSAPTILNVLEAPMGSEVPITMTSWDLAFLRSLYKAPQNLTAASQRSQIRRELKEELQKSDSGK